MVCIYNYTRYCGWDRDGNGIAALSPMHWRRLWNPFRRSASCMERWQYNASRLHQNDLSRWTTANQLAREHLQDTEDKIACIYTEHMLARINFTVPQRGSSRSEEVSSPKVSNLPDQHLSLQSERVWRRIHRPKCWLENSETWRRNSICLENARSRVTCWSTR